MNSALEPLYRRAARRHFEKRVEYFADELGIDHSELHLRNQQTRWGSFSPTTGVLSLNWRLVMAPPEVID